MSESSKKLYLHNLKKLNDNKPIENFNFLKKTASVMVKLPTNRNTARSYIIACVNGCKGRKGFKKALEFYVKEMDKINAELKDSTAKTDRYIQNEMKWEDILKIRDGLPKKSVECVLLCLFTMVPPRRSLDYCMKIGRPQEIGNWFDGHFFYFNSYKTKKTYNTQVEQPPQELLDVIDDYLVERPFKTDDLLVKKSGLPFKPKDIQMTLNRVLGKKISVTMSRSIFLSTKYGNVLEELKQDTDSMATSVSVAQSNYIKK